MQKHDLFSNLIVGNYQSLNQLIAIYNDYIEEKEQYPLCKIYEVLLKQRGRTKPKEGQDIRSTERPGSGALSSASAFPRTQLRMVRSPQYRGRSQQCNAHRNYESASKKEGGKGTLCVKRCMKNKSYTFWKALAEIYSQSSSPHLNFFRIPVQRLKKCLSISISASVCISISILISRACNKKTRIFCE